MSFDHTSRVVESIDVNMVFDMQQRIRAKYLYNDSDIEMFIKIYYDETVDESILEKILIAAPPFVAGDLSESLERILLKVKILTKTQNPIYYVTKIKFGKYKDKSKLILNKDITIENIPEKAYEYVVNGRSAIEWIMDQYQVKTDSKSGITDDPNEYSKDPKYIFNLLLSIINVSVQTVDLVNSFPPLDIIE